MARTRIAVALAVLVGGLLLAGCGKPATVTWHSTPSASATVGGQGGGEQMRAATTDPPTPTPVAPSGVITTTGTTDVALTFDDGPDPTYTPRILAILRNSNVKATFCLIGVNVRQYPDLVRQIAADGHTLCNHTWKHDLKLGSRGESAVRADLQRTADAIRAAVPDAAIPYFRHPGGLWTPTAIRVAESMGMRCAGWQVDTSDWNVARYRTSESMKQHVMAVLRGEVGPGAIVLMHDAGGDRSGTMAATEIAIPELAAKFTLIPLS